MRRLILFFSSALFIFQIQAQKVGGPCEGCEAIHEYGNKLLNDVDTLPDFNESKNKMIIRGTVYQSDGRTPAKDVILYVYHTNAGGIYPKRGDEKGWGRRHGYIRGWIKTDANGQYTFYTFRPGTYPNRREAAHVHITIKEPDKNEYWIDSYNFEDDPLLEKERSKKGNRGGSGIISLIRNDGFLICKRDIILGKNIPNYR